jgi:hypothetical protein
MDKTSLQEPLGALEAVLRVPEGNERLAGYYLRIGGTLHSTRPAGTPEGPALWQLESLPVPAVDDAAAAALLGRDVRRVMLCACSEDDSQLALVLDLGQQNYLHFYPLSTAEPAPAMALSPDCGDVETLLRYRVALPPVVTVGASVLRCVRAGRRLLGAGVAAFFGGVISAVLGVPETLAGSIALGGFVVGLIGMRLLQRKNMCPWCGKKEFAATGVTGCFCCNHCGNDVKIKL